VHSIHSNWCSAETWNRCGLVGKVRYLQYYTRVVQSPSRGDKYSFGLQAPRDRSQRQWCSWGSPASMYRTSSVHTIPLKLV